MLPTIGLEIHAELKTKTKMFCACRNDFDEKHPNINVCPICLGHPGTLPTINKRAVESVIRLGLALRGQIAEKSIFDRKSYFYPDLPKGYQISQYKHPLVIGGELKGIRIRRIHLEEDTGRLIHDNALAQGSPSLRSGRPASLVDFNRAGVPLLELVTEPDVKSAREAVDFAKELHLILRCLGISDADMEKGEMRIEANVSVDLGTKVEVKNLNSFKAVEGAVAHEIERQEMMVKEGNKIVQETRGWNEAKGVTESQRTKEEAHDYRYFPEPDLPPLDIPAAFDLEKLKAELPELPEEKRNRLIEEYRLNKAQSELLVSNAGSADFFESSISELKNYQLPITNYQLLFNYFTSDLFGLMKEADIVLNDLKITPENFAHLIALIEKQEITSRVAKDVLKEMFATGLDPEQIVKNRGLEQIQDEDVIKKAAEEAISENKQAVEDYKNGNLNSIQFLVGKTMAKLQGRASPEAILRILEELLTK